MSVLVRLSRDQTKSKYLKGCGVETSMEIRYANDAIEAKFKQFKSCGDETYQANWNTLITEILTKPALIPSLAVLENGVAKIQERKPFGRMRVFERGSDAVHDYPVKIGYMLSKSYIFFLDIDILDE